MEEKLKKLLEEVFEYLENELKRLTEIRDNDLMLPPIDLKWPKKEEYEKL